MTHWSIFIEFAVLSLMIGTSGYFLSLYGDVIAEKTGLGGTWVGFAMLATVTSLPELVTGVSAVTYVGVPNIALGDALGSCVFNLLLIVLLDFLHRGASVYTRISQGHILSAGFGVVLLGFVAVKQRGKMSRESGKTASKTVHPDMCHDPVFCRRNLGCYLWILLPKLEGAIL